MVSSFFCLQAYIRLSSAPKIYFMERICFKTNVDTQAGLQKITPLLNEAVGAGNWKVEVDSPDRLLTICIDKTAEISHAIKAMHKAGYRAENVDDYYSIF